VVGYALHLIFDLIVGYFRYIFRSSASRAPTRGGRGEMPRGGTFGEKKE